MHRSARGWLAMLAFVLGACGVLVDPESLVIKCEVTPGADDADPCIEAGLHCVSGICQACEQQPERCNGLDDDCDGTIDEGYDLDNDGYSWCGGGVLELSDCDPKDPEIHPSPLSELDAEGGGAVPELCDGKDNDCDDDVDEDPKCSATKTCQQTGCPTSLVCDSASGRCIVPRNVGSGCQTDAECSEGFCVDPSMFTSSEFKEKRCASACCTDADCSDDTVCEVGKTGMRACVPSEIAGRGTTGTGDACERASDCASGVCLRSVCRERCHTDTGCGAEEACVFGTPTLTDADTWNCNQPAGRGDSGEFCTGFDPTSCKSALCNGAQCAQPCGRSADCASGEVCSYTEVGTLVGAATAPICVMETSVSDTPCCTSSDCNGALCKPKSSGDGVLMVCQAP